jgi:uncharacterized membrane protein YqjE
VSLLFGSARRLLATVLAMGRARLELAGIELADERDRLFRIAAFGLLGAFALAISLVSLTVLVAVAFWDVARMPALIAITLVWMVLGLGAIWRAQYLARVAPPPMSLTLAELRRDLAALRKSIGGDGS